MDRRKETIIAFDGNTDLSQFIDERLGIAKSVVEQLPRDVILGYSVDTLTEQVSADWLLEPLVLDFEGMTRGDPQEVQIEYMTGPKGNTPTARDTQVVNVYVPFKGNSRLFDLCPSRELPGAHPRIFVEGGNVGFEVEVGQHVSKDRLKAEVNAVKISLTKLVNWSTLDVNSFNRALGGQVRSWIEKRRNALLHAMNLTSSLDIPVRRLEGSTPIFTVEMTRKKVSLSAKSFAPEPSLLNASYLDILHTLDEFGKVLARHPSTFSGMGEEDLRNVLLLGLTPLYGIEGSVTGETFNKGGKADILVRYRNENLFVAECKIWSGPKGYLKAIDQLLSYLTWRDSKSAILVFVNRKNFSRAITSLRKATPQHACYVRELERSSDSWMNYVVHLKDDASREAKIAVMLFHIHAHLTVAL